MKTHVISLKPLLSTAGFLLATLPATGFCGGWFLPTQYPAGQYHRYWAIGLSAPSLEQPTGMQTMKDGSHVFAFKAANGAGHIYIWDRISSFYDCPVVASTDPAFRTYTTLNRQNPTFTGNVYEQLRSLWGEGNATQSALMEKIRGSIDRNGDRNL